MRPPDFPRQNIFQIILNPSTHICSLTIPTGYFRPSMSMYCPTYSLQVFPLLPLPHTPSTSPPQPLYFYKLSRPRYRHLYNYIQDARIICSVFSYQPKPQFYGSTMSNWAFYPSIYPFHNFHEYVSAIPFHDFREYVLSTHFIIFMNMYVSTTHFIIFMNMYVSTNQFHNFHEYVCIHYPFHNFHEYVYQLYQFHIIFINQLPIS